MAKNLHRQDVDEEEELNRLIFDSDIEEEGDELAGGDCKSSSHATTGLSSSKDVLNQLQTAWQNEKNSHVMLPHKTELLQLANELVKLQENGIQQAPHSSAAATSIHCMENLVNALQNLEIQQIRYVITDYLRVRLDKIHNFCMWLLNEHANAKPDAPELLSLDELDYAKKYQDSIYKYHSQISNKLPAHMQNPNMGQMAFEPRADHFVFCRVNKPIHELSSILNAESSSSSQTNGDSLGNVNEKILIRFSTIQKYLLEGRVELL